MAKSYSTPDVYIERTPYVPTININATGTYVGGFVGKVKYGLRNTPVLIRSWAEYLDYFVSPLSDKPFEEGSYLPNMVYGFFQNGGSSCYVLNIATSAAQQATGRVGSTATVKAKYAGAEGNNIWVQRTRQPYATHVFVGTDAENLTEVETFVGDDESPAVINSASQYITVVRNGNMQVDENPVRLTGGADSGVIADANLGDYLTPFDKVFVDMISYAESGTAEANQALLNYCNGRIHYPAHAVLGVPSAATTVAEAKAMGISLGDSADGANRGNLYYPWLKVLNSYTGQVEDVPNQGHVQGMIIRTVTNRGRAKVPAGTRAGINGVVGLATDIDLVALGELNVANVCALITKANYGIVCWGGRSLFEGGRYISSVIMENQISRDLYEGMQPYVFETNTPDTWSNVRDTLDKYMRQCYERGEFDGSKASDAYVVICDGSINTPATIKQKKLNAKVAYKEIGCAEFVIVNLSRDME